jgi:predicted anti-sigma-YlaC factor YlaD
MIGIQRDRERGCARAREWVSLRLDGELSELERLLLRRHLSRCEGCRGFAESVEVVTRAVRESPHERPSRSLEPATPAPARPRARFRLALAALVVGAAAVGGVVGSLVGSSGDTSVPTAPGPTEIAELEPDTTERPPAVTTANV